MNNVSVRCLLCGRWTTPLTGFRELRAGEQDYRFNGRRLLSFDDGVGSRHQCDADDLYAWGDYLRRLRRRLEAEVAA